MALPDEEWKVSWKQTKVGTSGGVCFTAILGLMHYNNISNIKGIT